MKILLVGAVLLAGSAGAQTTACKTLAPDAQDALVASPANHTVLFEDADVRVLDVHSQPHTREAVHTHRLPSVMYIERQGAGTYDTPDGTDHRSHPTDPNFKPRVIGIKPEGPHWTENTGNVPFHAIRVEFKHPGCSLDGSPVKALGPEDAVVVAPEFHTVLLENDDVRVLDVRLPPHTKEPSHTHVWSGFFYVVQDEPLRYFTPERSNPPVANVTPNMTIVPVAPEGPHWVENVGDAPLHLVRFELKHGAVKAGAQPAK